MVERQTYTKLSPASAIENPSRRPTVIQFREGRLQEHNVTKLREDAEYDLGSIEKATSRRHPTNQRHKN